MLKPGPKRLLQFIIAAVLVFFALDLVAGLVCPDMWAFDAAAAVCQQNGWKPGDYSAADSNISGGLVGKIATLEFKPNDQTRCKTIRVTLRKPINLMPWKLMEYAEVPCQP